MNLNNIHSDWNEFFEENSETLQNILDKVLDKRIKYIQRKRKYLKSSSI